MALGRTARRLAARQEILQTCWDLAREHGLAGFTLRQVANIVGIRAPSLYSYFESKNAIYDAMFQSAAEAFERAMAAVPARKDPRQRLRSAATAYLTFCTEDPVRYALLFQRILPGFEPSEEAYRPALGAYEHLRRSFAEIDITDQRHLDLWTALLTGLATQQLSNEPGGTRWKRLIRSATDMFLAHVNQDLS